TRSAVFLLISMGSPTQFFVRSRGVQKGVQEYFTVFCAVEQNFVLMNNSFRHCLGRAHDKVCEATPLKFGRTLQEFFLYKRNASLKPLRFSNRRNRRCSCDHRSHFQISLRKCTFVCRTRAIP